MDHELVGTADICDLEPKGLRVVRSTLKHYGGNSRCSGPVTTIRLDTGSHGLKQLLANPGNGGVVAVDVGGRYFSVVGDRVGTLAHQNNWFLIKLNKTKVNSVMKSHIDGFAGKASLRGSFLALA